MANEKQLSEILRRFEDHGIVCHLVHDRAAALTVCMELARDASSVSWGGSMTLGEIGLPEAIERTGIRVIKRVDGTLQERYLSARETLTADVYFSSANALTRDGKIVNIDGFGNRVAAHIFGPHKVVFVAGVNKMTGTLDEALYRVRNIASPPNVRRLGTGAPCGELEYCNDCAGPGRICNDLVIIENVRMAGRVHLVLVNEDLGF